MSKDEFKNKYFTNNFYWVNFDNHITLQLIALEVGCLLHTGEKEVINWHEGFNNLGFRTRNGVTYMQKEPFLTEKESATDFNKMFKEYENLRSPNENR